MQNVAPDPGSGYAREIAGCRRDPEFFAPGHYERGAFASERLPRGRYSHCDVHFPGLAAASFPAAPAAPRKGTIAMTDQLAAGPPAAPIIVRLRGALDVAAAPALRERLIGLLHPGMRLLVLDLSRVPSCDPAGLAVLIGTQRRAGRLGIVVRLAAPSLPVVKLLRLTGLDRSLTVCPDLRGALAVERHEPVKASPSAQVLAG
jgi:anti-anti-sigma factor